MNVLVISNDVVPGFGVPVAAPGLRAAGLAEGLRDHGHHVTVSVPADVLAQIDDGLAARAPEGTVVVSPPALMTTISELGAQVVVFINANLTPHLQPVDGVHFVYDMFAPKLLESLASADDNAWKSLVALKERAFALADEVWVNGRRKLGYALGWMTRPTVDHMRVSDFDRPSLVNAALLSRLSVVEMPVPLPADVTPRSTAPGGVAVRLGVAGYAQPWSRLAEVHRGHQMLVDAGFELHALLPGHWGGASAPATSALPEQTQLHSGPLEFVDFARWVQSMHAMVDVFAPSAERRFAMITRSAVALRLGVPVIHAVDSEIADIVREHNAGWVLDPDDAAAWSTVVSEVNTPTILADKCAGAVSASLERFAPIAALRQAARGGSLGAS